VNNGKLFLTCVALLAVPAFGQTKATTKAAPKAAAAAPKSAAPAAPKSDAPVSGIVVFKGTAPRAAVISMDAEPTCAAKHKTPVRSEKVIVNPNGTLRNVFIYVKTGLEGKTFPAPTESVTLAQDGCMYVPHVFGIMANQQLKVVNDDATTHNIHALPEVNEEFNVGQRAGQGPVIKMFAKPEATVPLVCNQHPWMRAEAHVVSNPFYAVTGEDGSFELKGLLPGKYTIEAIHEKYGASRQQVTVEAGKNTPITFTFSAAQSYMPPSLTTLPALMLMPE
jgi:hypothetical protein